MDKQLLIFGFDSQKTEAEKSELKSELFTKKSEQASSTKMLAQKIVSDKTVTEWKIFVDGAARGNPGPAGAGIYILNSKQEFKGAFFLGEKTNNQAEYLALILALFLLKQNVSVSDLKSIHLTIHSDSELLVRQLCGFYKIKNSMLIKLNGVVKQLLRNIPHKFIHVMREKNKVADLLANEGIDKKKKIPTNFFKFLANLSDADNIV